MNCQILNEMKIIFSNKIAVVFLFFTCSNYIHAQSVVYYPFNSVLGISSNPAHAVWVDVKLQTNSYFSSLSTDISPEFTVKKTPKSLTYLGVGAKLNYLNLIENNNILEGYFLNFGVRVMPFEKYKRIHIAFEISPYAGRNFDIGVFRSNLGIGYDFSKKK
jgi:hypothetical protein